MRHTTTTTDNNNNNNNNDNKIKRINIKYTITWFYIQIYVMPENVFLFARASSA